MLAVAGETEKRVAGYRARLPCVVLSTEAESHKVLPA